MMLMMVIMALLINKKYGRETNEIFFMRSIHAYHDLIAKETKTRLVVLGLKNREKQWFTNYAICKRYTL